MFELYCSACVAWQFAPLLSPSSSLSVVTDIGIVVMGVSLVL